AEIEERQLRFPLQARGLTDSADSACAAVHTLTRTRRLGSSPQRRINVIRKRILILGRYRRRGPEVSPTSGRKTDRRRSMDGLIRDIEAIPRVAFWGRVTAVQGLLVEVAGPVH